MNAMKVIVRITNLMRGANRTLAHPKLPSFSSEVDSTYGNMRLHSETRWLSVLAAFFDSRKE